jgi:hypothetical protein
MEWDCQSGCLKFSYKSGVVSLVMAYHNKWPSDWQQHGCSIVRLHLLRENYTQWLRGCFLPSTIRTQRIRRVPKGTSLL